MRIRRESLKAARTLFRACFVGDKLDESRVVQTAKKIRTASLRGKLEILSAFRQFVFNELSERTLSVESATPLADSGKTLFAAVEAGHSPVLQREYKVNPDLIGGVRIRLGSQVWDGSVRSRLHSLEASLS